MAANAQTITPGTGTSLNTTTGFPAPYGNYYNSARHQFIILKSEINAAGYTGFGYIESLGFNVSTPGANTLNSYEIKIGNTSVTSFTSTAFKTSPPTAFGPANYKDVAGWNTHLFTTPFYWDGNSNILVEICFNNSVRSTNATAYYTTMSYNSSVYRTSNSSSTCTQTAQSLSTKRPNMQLRFIPAIAPTAAFVITDSLWARIPLAIKNTSANYYRAYWSISGVPPTFCNAYGCFNDSGTDVNYVFPDTGTYGIRLVTLGYFGIDSVTQYIAVKSVSQKPVADFSVVGQFTATPKNIQFTDLSTNGVAFREWSISPACFSCLSDPFVFPNSFAPDRFAKNPNMYLFDPGVFDICLKVTNELGSDSLCKKNVLNVQKGYSMCNGNDSLSTLSQGYLYDGGGPDQNYYLNLTGQCPAGFVINPYNCADSVILYVDQFRLRTTDTLHIRDGSTPTSPIIKKIYGSNLPQSSKVIVATSGKMHLRMSTGSGSSSAGDSGFVLHWNIIRSGKIFSPLSAVCPGTTTLLRTTRKAGRTYLWSRNAIATLYTDTFYNATTPGLYQVNVSGTGCIDTATFSLSAADSVAGNLGVNTATQCLNGNIFAFADLSVAGPAKIASRIWFAGDNTTSADSLFLKHYSKEGVYHVSLVSRSAQGCTDTMGTDVTVLPAPVSRIASGSPSIVCSNDSGYLYSLVQVATKYNWYVNGATQPADTMPVFYGKQTGAYKLRITDSAGCDSFSAPAYFIFWPQPMKPTITERLGTLYSSASNGNSWYLNDSLLPGTAANKTFYKPVTSGNYSVRIDSNGCNNRSDAYVILFAAMREARAHNNTLFIYPNPASTWLEVVSQVPVTWSITDLAGRLLLASSATVTTDRIDISTLRDGLYLLKAIGKDGASFTRFEKH